MSHHQIQWVDKIQTPLIINPMMGNNFKRSVGALKETSTFGHPTY
jgi:hypothetical protein